MSAFQQPLRYGMNPHQRPAWAEATGPALPITVLNGAPSLINLLDALNAWPLVREARQALGLPAAASFKHVSPAGTAVAAPLDDALRRAYAVEDLDLSPLAIAYARARGADRVSAFGDFVALSDPVDRTTAELLRREVSDGVIAPDYEPAALDVLRQKRRGGYLILAIDPTYEPPPVEVREVFGVRLVQRRNDQPIRDHLLANTVTRQRPLPEQARQDAVLGLITLKYTQSNSICVAHGGQTIGIGAGQQSRIHCTRLAAGKADLWRLRQHPAVLGLRFRPGLSRPERDNAIDVFLSPERTAAEEQALRAALAEPVPFLTDDERAAWLAGWRGATLCSDGFIPFPDTVERARRSGVAHIVQPGGSQRDAEVIAACDAYDMTMVFTGLRLFHH